MLLLQKKHRTYHFKQVRISEKMDRLLWCSEENIGLLSEEIFKEIIENKPANGKMAERGLGHKNIKEGSIYEKFSSIQRKRTDA